MINEMMMNVKENLIFKMITFLFVLSVVSSFAIGQALALQKYRFVVDVSGASAGDPIWVNIDFPRWLLKDNVRDPINLRSVEVYTVPSSGPGVSVPALLDSNLGTLAYHYNKGMIVKFKAVSGISQYEIYFDVSDNFNYSLPPDHCQLGVGEVLRYDYSQQNYLWGGWSGRMPVVSDVDLDGDWDIHLTAYDGGRFIARNVGTNQAPIFLPPSRYLKDDSRVQPLSSPYSIDWDGDGDYDRLTYTTYDDGYNDGAVFQNKIAVFDIEFNNGGVYSSKQRLVDSNGIDMELERAMVVSVSVIDVDNDGLQDILACGSNNYIVVYLNKGMVNAQPKAERVLLPITGNDGNGYAIDPNVEEMSLQALPFDWDEDRDDDLIVTGWHHWVFLLENDPVPNQIRFKTAVWFDQKGGPINNGDCAAPCTLDWDNDGDLDMMVGGANGQILYCENIGTRAKPNFSRGEFMKNSQNKIISVTAESTNGTIQGSGETYWGYLTMDHSDWDQDGDQDLIINDSLGRLSWIENVGTVSSGVLSSNINRFEEVPDIGSGIEAHWKLDGNYNDSSGNGHNLSSVGSGGSPTYSLDGVFNGCYIFDNSTAGQAECLRGSLSINSSDAFTITAWINPSSLQDGFTSTSPHTIVKLYNTNNSDLIDFRIRDGKLDVYYTNPSVNYLTDANIPINSWSFVAVSCQQNVIKIFLNGKLVYHHSTDGGQSYNGIYIGSAIPTEARGLNGKIDDIRLYNRELSDADIELFYNEEIANNLQGLWRFNGNMLDSSGNSNDLTSVGLGGVPSLTATGVSQEGCLLDNTVEGQAQCLRGDVSIDSTKAVTMLLWVKPSSLADGFTAFSPHTMMRLIDSVNGNVLDFRIRDGKIDVYYTNPVANHLSSQFVPLGVWSYIGVVQDGQTLKFYMNGALVFSSIVDGGQNYDRLYIGASSGSVSRGINGIIDEARLYNRALNDGEIASLYDSDLASHKITTPWRNRPGVADFTGDGIDEIIAMDSAGRLVMYKQSSQDINVLERMDWIRDQQSIPIIVNSQQANALGRTQLDVADWDGDGDLDIMAGEDWALMGSDASIFYLENTGSNSFPVFSISKLQARGSNFIEWTGNNGKYNGHSPHPEMVDFDNDGDMDLLVGTESGRITYYEHEYFIGSSYPGVAINKFQKDISGTWQDIP